MVDIKHIVYTFVLKDLRYMCYFCNELGQIYYVIDENKNTVQYKARQVLEELSYKDLKFE